MKRERKIPCSCDFSPGPCIETLETSGGEVGGDPQEELFAELYVGGQSMNILETSYYRRYCITT